MDDYEYDLFSMAEVPEIKWKKEGEPFHDDEKDMC